MPWPAAPDVQTPPAVYDLTAETARRIAAIVHAIAGVDAVAITDTTRILALAGDGCPNMQPGRAVQTDATRIALRTGEPARIHAKDALSCPVPGCPCPIQAAAIAPLKIRGRVVGTVKFYHRRSDLMPEFIMRLALGISELLSLQFELEQAEHERELVAQARLHALEAQIRPHFLFNTLNTIIATSRHQPARARALLTELAAFLRHNFVHQTAYATLAEELEFVRIYLRLEEARFGDRLRAVLRVQPAALDCIVPVLTLQPLVENAVVHGLAPRDGGGRLAIVVRRRADRVRLAVVDDGVGFDPDRPVPPRAATDGHGGLGLANVHQRLVAMFGADAGLRIRSRAGRGTAVLTRVPATVAPRPSGGGQGGAAPC